MTLKFNKGFVEINNYNDFKKWIELLKEEKNTAMSLAKIWRTGAVNSTTYDNLIIYLENLYSDYTVDSFTDNKDAITNQIESNNNFNSVKSEFGSIFPGTAQFDKIKCVYEYIGESLTLEDINFVLDLDRKTNLFKFVIDKYYEEKFNENFIDVRLEKIEKLSQDVITSKSIAEETMVIINEYVDTEKENATTKVDELLEKCDDRYNKLEAAHRKKLDVDTPSTYWNKSKDSYMISFWVSIITTVIVSLIIFFAYLQVVFPFFNSLHLDKENSFFKILTSSGVMLSISSIIIYNLFKLSFSFYNLAQDSKERAELIRTYYSFIADGKLEENQASNQIIFNSIFARTDSGLLKSQDTIIPSIKDVIK